MYVCMYVRMDECMCVHTCVTCPLMLKALRGPICTCGPGASGHDRQVVIGHPRTRVYAQTNTRSPRHIVAVSAVRVIGVPSPVAFD